jgi:hypothetical protein
MVGKRFRSDKERDPIAELARLMAQADTDQESAPSDNRFREETVSNGYDETPELPPAPQLAVDLNELDQACERDEYCSDDQTYDVDDELYAAEEEYEDREAPPHTAEEEYQNNEVIRVRRHSPTLLMAIVGLALIGTACAVSYRDMFGGSGSPGLPPTIKAVNEPNRIVPAPSELQAERNGNVREVGPATTGSIDNVVSQKKQSAAIGPPKSTQRASLARPSAPTTPAAGQAVPNQAVPRVAVAADPPAPRPTIAAASRSPGQSNGADVTAASNHEYLAAVPFAHANADSSAAAPVVASGYAVQVASERSESRAQAAFRRLQVKYPNQLSGRQPIIRRGDLAAAGIYYRALVGPFASAEKAARLCSVLKASGGDCIVQKN